MARVSFVEKDQAHPLMQEVYTRLENQGTQVLNLHKVMAHCPWIGRNFLRLGNSILKGEELPAKLRELAILRVGNLLQAEYEVTKHVPLAMQAGVSQKQIDQLLSGSHALEFDDNEKVVLEYTDSLTKDCKADNETFEKLKGFLSDRAIVELTAAIGYYNMVCRILVGLQIELEK
jgi:4-carboxymuconolactone decarboxylase